MLHRAAERPGESAYHKPTAAALLDLGISAKSVEHTCRCPYALLERAPTRHSRGRGELTPNVAQQVAQLALIQAPAQRDEKSREHRLVGF